MVKKYRYNRLINLYLVNIEIIMTAEIEVVIEAELIVVVLIVVVQIEVVPIEDPHHVDHTTIDHLSEGLATQMSALTVGVKVIGN